MLNFTILIQTEKADFSHLKESINYSLLTNVTVSLWVRLYISCLTNDKRKHVTNLNVLWQTTNQIGDKLAFVFDINSNYSERTDWKNEEITCNDLGGGYQAGTLFLFCFEFLKSKINFKIKSFICYTNVS